MFSGEDGLKSIDPGLSGHGIAIGIARILQRMMTSDCDYCEGLARSLRSGALVMALKVDEQAVEDVSDVLRRTGVIHWLMVLTGTSCRCRTPLRPRVQYLGRSDRRSRNGQRTGD